ncbi:MAG: ATP-binding protein [candidate division Zixibacteria bacterium]|nr:ATP-binding protein [candidate division Zixibacteria bacterium]MCI0597223.1 ATP-binding protein [candidate division Zixibacteria bacterium]
MAEKLGRWSFTLKLSTLLLILFFVVSNFSFLWLSYRAKNALEAEIKVKLEDAAVRLSRMAADPRHPAETHSSVQQFLFERGLLAFGFFKDGLLPTVWTALDNKTGFATDFRPVNEPALSGPIEFGEHFTCTYSFPAFVENKESRPAGFVIAQVDSRGRLEELFRLQTFFWVLGFLLMAATVSLLWRFVLAPFEAVEKKAAEAHLPLPGTKPGSDPAELTIARFEKALAELKAKERELSRLYAESEKKAVHYSALSKHLIDSLGSGIVIFNPSGAIVDFNPAAERLLGLGEKRQLPGSLKKVLPEVKPGPPTESVELEVQTGGRTKILAVSASVISNPKGENLGKALLVSDLTDFKEMESKLKEREHWAFLGETAAGLAHELRNALAVMVGYGKLLAKAVGESHPSHKTAGELLRESLAAEETLKRFLEYARPEQVFIEPLDLRTLLEETLAPLRSRFPSVNFQAGAPDKAPCRSDAAAVKRIFSNLLLNAAEAAGDGGWVKVELEACAAPAGWKIEVADSGPGVSAEQKQKIFSPFFTTKPDGTGLGLALVQKAVQLLEGSIRLEEGKRGAVFALTLPEVLGGLPQKNEIQKKHRIRG